MSRDVLTMLCADLNPYVGARAAQTLARLKDTDVLSDRKEAFAAAS